MGWVARWRIGARLAMGFGLLLLLIAALIGSSYRSLQDIGEENRQLLEQELVKVAAVSVIDTATRANGLATSELLLVAPQQVPEVQARINANRVRIDEALQTLDRLVTRPEGRAALVQLRTARAAYVASCSKIPPLVLADQLEQARQRVRDDTLPALGRLQAPIDTLRQLQESLAQAHGQAVTDGIGEARTLLVVLGTAALLLGCVASVVLARSIVRPLRNGVAMADRIAAGDLTQPVDTQGHDEVADLLRAQKMNPDVGIWTRGVERGIFNPDRRSLDLRRGYGIKDDEPVIGFVGRLVVEKGLDVFCDAIDALNARKVRHKVLIIGDGPARAWFQQRLPDAIFAGNDAIALGIINYLLKEGFKVPEDVSVLGFDNVAYAESALVPLSTVSQTPYQLGFTMGEQMLSELKADENHLHQHVVFQPQIVERASTAPKK